MVNFQTNVSNGMKILNNFQFPNQSNFWIGFQFNLGSMVLTIQFPNQFSEFSGEDFADFAAASALAFITFEARN